MWKMAVKMEREETIGLPGKMAVNMMYASVCVWSIVDLVKSLAQLMDCEM